MKLLRVGLWLMVVVAPAMLASCSPAQKRPAPAVLRPAHRLDLESVARAESLIEDAIGRGDIPGAVLLAGRADEVLYRKALGHQALEPAPEPMTLQTIFDMASLTKPVATATCVMKLIEMGKVGPQDPVGRHLPEFASNGKESITVEQLLLHTGGLIPDNELSDYDQGPEEAWRNICSLECLSPPGQRFAYTDVGYIVLGQLVQRVGGAALDEFAAREIFRPLGMAWTRYNPPAHWMGRIAPTEKGNGQFLRGRVHDPRAARLDGVAGHAGLFSTADDLALYCRMILGGSDSQGRTVLGRETLDLMIQPRPVPGGVRTLGFDCDTAYSSSRGWRFKRGVTFGHTGFTGTMFWLDPESRSYVIFLASRLHPDGVGDVIALRRAVVTALAEAILGPMEEVLPGVDGLILENFKSLAGQRVGLITNTTGRSRFGARTIDILNRAPGVKLVKIFTPEHGLGGVADGQVGDAKDSATGLPILSLYGQRRRPTPEMLADIDTLVFDIQDVGTRFYTYMTTMGYAMEEAAKAGKKFVVLDRPNPIGFLGPDGPVADPDKLGFTCYKPLPLVHGMTLGELAGLFNGEYAIGCKLQVVPIRGWRREMAWDQTGIPWVNPSPNIRNPGQALLYPAVGVMEFANLSVGRGTPTPFELFGAPWVEGAALAGVLQGAKLPGLRFEPVTFTPTASKFANEVCQGVRILITDPHAVQPARSGLTFAWALKRLFGQAFESDRVMDLLADTESDRAWQEAATPASLPEVWKADLERFKKVRSRYLLYP